MTREMMLKQAQPLLERALKAAERVRVKDVDLAGTEDIPGAVERCWHDALSDLDVEVWGVPAAELVQELDLFGASVQGNVLRLVTCDGFRADIICHDAPADLPDAQPFWFIAVQALGKLLRRDYLIAAHLSHMLVMDTLVDQMVERDKMYHTNHHRWGYAEKLNYLAVDTAPYADLMAGDQTYGHIARQLISAALCTQGAQTFFALWRQYIKELKA